MPKELTLEELAYAAKQSDLPDRLVLCAAIEHCVNQLARALAGHLGIDCGTSTLETDGVFTPLYPRNQGDPIPDAIAPFHEAGDWHPIDNQPSISPDDSTELSERDAVIAEFTRIIADADFQRTATSSDYTDFARILSGTRQVQRITIDTSDPNLLVAYPSLSPLPLHPGSFSTSGFQSTKPLRIAPPSNIREEAAFLLNQFAPASR